MDVCQTLKAGEFGNSGPRKNLKLSHEPLRSLVHVLPGSHIPVHTATVGREIVQRQHHCMRRSVAAHEAIKKWWPAHGPKHHPWHIWHVLTSQQLHRAHVKPCSIALNCEWPVPRERCIARRAETVDLKLAAACQRCIETTRLELLDRCHLQQRH